MLKMLKKSIANILDILDSQKLILMKSKIIVKISKYCSNATNYFTVLSNSLVQVRLSRAMVREPKALKSYGQSLNLGLTSGDRTTI